MINFQMMIHTIGKLPNEIIRDYINIRYERWLDSARYKCSKVGMNGKESEVLSEVVFSLMNRDENFLMKLLNAKKIQKGKEYTELDFFVLRAIDLNVNSETSPYRYKNRMIPVNSSVKFERLKIIDEDLVDEVDKSEVILKQFRLVRWIFSGLDLTDLERAVFEYRFINNEPFSEWPGSEKTKKLYCIYTQVVRVIQTVLCERGLSLVRPKSKLTKREAELVTQFLNTHKIHKQKKEFNI